MIGKSLQALLMLSTLFAFLACGGASEEECDLYCGDNGSCEFVEGEATCVCQAGYKGYNCETEIDECEDAPCLNGGICTDEVNGYSCTCASGYEGDNCEIIADDCASNPCQNGGTCVDGANSYTCECAAGYEGTNCETNIDDCADTPCQNGGTCTDGVDSYSCECATGFEGDDCEINIDDCTEEPCLNGGTCLDGVDSYTCECLANYEGDHCEIPIDDNDCLDEPCQNGGTCIDGVDSYTCECLSGFEGDNCEINIDDCPAEACQNGGSCVDGVNAYTCECINGYEGDNCETCMGLIASGECLHLRIFVSDWQGAGNFGGVAAADAICNSDANSPDNTKHYKALLGQAGAREMNTDWPLVADATYYRVDGQTIIDTTTADAIFAFDLANSINDISQECWTGLNDNFTTSSSQCSNWTTASDTANMGISNRINSAIIFAYAQFCSRTNVRLYCVESPCEAGLLWSGSECVNGSPPTASIPSGIEVTGSGMAIVNGWYYEDGMHDGQTQYKHESEDVWLFWLRMEDAWVISDDTSAWDTWGSFHYYDHTSASQIPETGWENGSNVSGDITVLQHQAMTGTPYVDQELTAHYVYQDVDGDLEGETQFTWYRCDTPSDSGQVITTTTGPYALTSLDANKYIKLEVTPVAQTGWLIGPSTVSTEVFGPVRPFRSLGIITSGETMGGRIVYSDIDDILYLSWVDYDTRAVSTGAYDGTLADLGFIDETKDSDGPPWMTLGADGKPVIVFKNSTDGHKASVHRYDGMVWSDLGDANFPAYGANCYGPRVEVGPDDLPVVIYQGGSVQRPHASKYTGSGWEDLGQIFGSNTNSYSMAVDFNNVPLVTITYSNTMYVKEYTGHAWNNWTTPFDTGQRALTLVDSSKERPTIAGINDGPATVSRWEANQWMDLGGPASTSVDAIGDLVYDQADNLYLVIADQGSHVLYRYDNISTWEQLGVIGASGSYVSLALDGAGRAYVVFKDPEQGNKLHFLEFHQ